MHMGGGEDHAVGKRKFVEVANARGFERKRIVEFHDAAQPK